MTKTESTLETRKAALGRESSVDTSTRTLRRGLGQAGVQRAAFALPAVIALVLSCIDLTGRSIWLDESATASIASQNGTALWHAIAHDGGNMSGYYLILHLLFAAFGDGLVVMRIPSAIATGVTVFLVSLLTNRLFGKTAAFVAGLLGAVSLPLVFWGQDARGYALMVTFVTASFYFLVELDRRVAARASIRSAWIGYLVTTTLAAYMSYVALLAVLAQLVWVVLARRPLRAVAQALAISVVLWVPLVILAVNRGTGQLDWLSRPGIGALAVVVATIASASQQPDIHQTATSNALETLTAVVVLGVLVLAVLFAREKESRRQLGLLASWIAVPVLLAFAESYAAQPVFLSRNLLMCVPPVGIVASLAVVEPRIPRGLGVGALAVVAGLRIAQVVPSYAESPENWRAATAYVVARSSPLDCVAFYPSDGRQAFDYYVLHTSGDLAIAPHPVLPPLSLRVIRPYVEVYTTVSSATIRALQISCARLWVVSSHTGSPEGTASSKTHYLRYEQLLTRLGRAFAPVRVANFGWAYPVRVELFSSAAVVQGRRA
ncbi:MAG: glycosyltransferase family 39 protein [Acidimicrobiales bacterium]